MKERKRERDGASSWREHVRIVKKTETEHDKRIDSVSDSGEPTSQTEKERCEVCWKEGSKMKCQQLYEKMHGNVCQEEPMFIRALLGHSGNDLDISTFSPYKV